MGWGEVNDAEKQEDGSSLSPTSSQQVRRGYSRYGNGVVV